MSLNKVTLIGRLGTDPETKNVGGNYLAVLNLATSESWTDKDGQKQERTEWHKVNFWGKQAELASKYLSKGRQVYVEGSLQTRSWETETGEKRYSTDIRGSRIVFLGGSGETSASATSGSTGKNYAANAASGPENGSMADSIGVPNMVPTFDENENLPF